VSVDIWFTQDISQIILAAVRANEQALAAERADSDLPHELAYHQGFKAALSALALALGLPIPSPISDEQRRTDAESALATHAGPRLFVKEGNEGMHQSELSVVPAEESRGHRSAVV
jgi:hypothetical protein